MIISKVRGQNFLSIGNAFLEVDLQKYQKTVIQGRNGSLKSGIANLITFALFGQTIKGITKPQIVNSINGKNCVVEIEFSVQNNSYLVRRGIKPNIFQIIENGTELPATLATDFQDYLEKNILKTNFKTFIQTCILSVENYRPFMTLPKGERRNFIEDILDIRVFTYMNQIVKTNMARSKERVKLLELEIKSAFQKAKIQKEHVETLEKIRGSSQSELIKKLESFNSDISSTLAEIEFKDAELKTVNSTVAKCKVKTTEHQKILNKIDELERKIDSVQKRISDITESVCPTCHTPIDEHKQEDLSTPLRNELNDLYSKKQFLLDKLPEYEQYEDLLTEAQNKVTELNADISAANIKVKFLNKEVSSLQVELSNISASDELSDLKANLRLTAEEALRLKKELSSVNEEMQYYDLMLDLFKDSGIKTKIIDQYVPIINMLVNKYLEKMDFFVSFNLDSEFNEVIKSRHRDQFSYSSFSAGERARIDLALIFTFRELARIRSAFDCNILFLDEILEFLDDIQIFLNMIYEEEFKSTNIFIISHRSKDMLAEIFDGVLTMHKESGFSICTDNSR